MSAREELTDIIDNRWHGYGYNPQGAADAILDAGYVKVSEGGIERAARLLCAANNLGIDYWERYPEGSLIKEKFRDQARTALAAALGSDTTNQEGTQ